MVQQMGSMTVTIEFPVSLNFLVYAWRVSDRAEKNQMPFGWAPSGLWPAAERQIKVEQVWNVQLDAMAHVGVAGHDGQCLADPAYHLRELFAPGTHGDQAFHATWDFFVPWWSQSRNAYDLAAAPFLDAIRSGHHGISDSLTVLILYDELPGLRRDFVAGIVVPFEQLIRNASQ